MNAISAKDATSALQSIIGCAFRFGIKSPDMDLYQIGFGEDVVFINYFGNRQEASKYAIHFTCGLHLDWSDGKQIEYDSQSDAKTFHREIESLIGLPVKTAEVLANNNVFIDLGLCKLEIVVREDGDESWRFFQPGQNSDHIVCCGKEISAQ